MTKFHSCSRSTGVSEDGALLDKWVVEGRAPGKSSWSTEYAGLYAVEFDTEEHARRAVDALVRVCGVARADLRVTQACRNRGLEALATEFKDYI